MPHNSILQLFFPIGLAVLVSACMVTKPYKKPAFETENLFPYDQVDLDSTTLADMPWQAIFQDPQLQGLIKEALQNNPDLQQAIEQIRIAEANFYQANQSMLPSLDVNGDFSYVNRSDNSVNFGESLRDISIPPNKQFILTLASSWEIDVWGKLASARNARMGELVETEATRRAIQTKLIADVANNYYRLLALDRQLEITRETVENRAQDVQTVKSLKEGGVVTGVSVQQSIANQYAAAVTIPELKQQITEQKNTLCLLLGRSPGTIERNSLAEQSPIDSLATGVPAQLLNNRPDIIAAENGFRSAFELTNNARAYFYPSLTITAEGGLQSLRTRDFFMPGSIFYNLIGGLTQPLFNQGQNEAHLKRSKAGQQQALLNLHNTILEAGAEVSDALSRYKNAEEKLTLQQYQIEALENAVEYSRELLQFGEANYTEVLTAQQNLLAAQLDNVNYKLDQLVAGVNLYRALGGGWQTNEAFTYNE